MNHFFTPTADPSDIYKYRDSIYAVDLLTAAVVEFNFYTELAKNEGTATEIEVRFGIASRPLDVLLTLSKALGLVGESNGVFKATRKAREFLADGSLVSLRPYYASLMDRPVAGDFVNVLRTGRPANWSSSKKQMEWTKAMETEGFAEKFTAAMDCRGAYLAPVLAQRLDLSSNRQLLDIAGGSGIYACGIVDHHKHLLAAVFEKPPVDTIAREMIASRGFADRVDVVAGDMFKEAIPTGFDVHLLSNVVHDWDIPEVKLLLQKSFEALPPGGKLIIHDAHLNESKDGPIGVAEYSCILMHSTEGRCYSISEMQQYLTEIGFTGVIYVDTVVNRSALVTTKPG